MSAKQYLIELGVDESRLEITSYGEERLDDYGDSELLSTSPGSVQPVIYEH